ncbi:MAG: signal peptidase I [Anaeroplasmataceae bacterium]
MNKKVKKIFTISGTVLTITIVLLVLYMLICNVIAVRTSKPVSYFGYSYSYVPTSSMEPTINAGDTIIFKKCDYSTLKKGDIIVYRSSKGSTEGMYIVHRINEVYTDGFEMLGDNNNGIVDIERVTEDMLVGKYVRTFNFLNLGKIASNKTLIYGLLVVFFVGIIILESVNLFLNSSKNKKLKEEKDKLRSEILSDMREEILKEILSEKQKDENNNKKE